MNFFHDPFFFNINFNNTGTIFLLFPLGSDGLSVSYLNIYIYILEYIYIFLYIFLNIYIYFFVTYIYIYIKANIDVLGSIIMRKVIEILPRLYFLP